MALNSTLIKSTVVAALGGLLFGFDTAVITGAKGQSLGSATHWIMNALISGVFPIVAARSKPAPFVFFFAMMALQFWVVVFFYPETKKRGSRRHGKEAGFRVTVLS